ncbi:glutamine synthetase family protein [Mycoplasma marinum]|uniref:Type I glutamate--ammonia ligase n=1 Tax=Mycoplasma marinum TaxID=1937190 RepID=A0A4V2NI49_9MOLU|nr:glutamine synthetase family protein [Mycoplasma marinum]TCG11478.1 type I glutamate--ammonia ligase [Mycoplasma marinum]
MTRKTLMKKIENSGIEFIQMQFINILGELHSVEIPVNNIEDILDSKIMIDGSSIKGYTTIKDSDLFLKPDLETFLILHFFDTPYKVARFICDILKKDGTILEGAPRQILRKVESKYQKQGLQLFAGLEAEFFLLKRNDNGEIVSSDNAKYFGVTPFDTTADLKREISMQLIKHDFNIEAFHKEVAPGQHEINYKYDTVLKTADRMITFKWIVKTVSKRHGYIATFMPKPFKGVNGSGLHTNISVFKNEKNLFCNDKNELSTYMMHFISGISQRIREISLLTNPSVNSYKRLVPGFEAPNCIAWSDSNRSTMIRVPASRGMGTRVEVRCVDAISNPYIMLAAIFSAGMEGIKNKAKPMEPVYENLFKLSTQELKAKGIEMLPANLGESIELFKESTFVEKLLGKEQKIKYQEFKYTEWYEYTQVVHNWEIEKYIKY